MPNNKNKITTNARRKNGTRIENKNHSRGLQNGQIIKAAKVANSTVK
jgi:hypothetical protein